MKEHELTEPGWYWFEPETIDIGRSSCFLNFDDVPEVKYLNCKKYRGNYYGPLDIEQLKNQVNTFGGLILVENVAL